VRSALVARMGQLLERKNGLIDMPAAEIELAESFSFGCGESDRLRAHKQKPTLEAGYTLVNQEGIFLTTPSDEGYSTNHIRLLHFGTIKHHLHEGLLIR
jgi:hypothetical protein